MPAKKNQETKTKKQKPALKPVRSAKRKAEVQKRDVVQKTGLIVDVYGVHGKKVKKMALPKELFGAKVNKKLMAQAVRVYLANQRAGSAITKTRGEVSGTTHKVWRQKGTGRARHGSRKAPIFVKGGVALGPRPKDFSLSLSKKMKRAALFSALSSKLQDGGIKVVLGLETLAPKTKLVANTLQSLGLMTKNKKVLLVLPFVQEKGLPAGRQGKSNTENILKAARNIEGISMFPANQLNTYTILASRTVLFMEDAIESMEKHFIKEE